MDRFVYHIRTRWRMDSVIPHEHRYILPIFYLQTCVLHGRHFASGIKRRTLTRYDAREQDGHVVAGFLSKPRPRSGIKTVVLVCFDAFRPNMFGRFENDIMAGCDLRDRQPRDTCRLFWFGLSTPARQDGRRSDSTMVSAD